jgi:methylated-DNA-[protein]-cysteine S-methyltransferase
MLHSGAIEVAEVRSPVGRLTIAARQDCVCALWFGTREQLAPALARWYPGEHIVRGRDPGGAAVALEAYFAGRLAALDDLPVELNGTPFQQRVWQRLRTVRAGTTASYADIARSIGAPAAVRAVGAANGANPVALIVPCHRIVGSNGRLTGYGGGLDRKRWLLDHESGGVFEFERVSAS